MTELKKLNTGMEYCFFDDEVIKQVYSTVISAMQVSGLPVPL